MARGFSWPSGQAGLTADRHRIRLEPTGLFPIQLSRLSGQELDEIWPYTAPLEPDYRCSSWLNSGNRLVLPKVFLAAQALFGPSSRFYDDYKCSFRFPLLLSASRKDAVMRYIVVLRDVRGAVEILYERVGERISEEMKRRYHSPVEGELSREDLNCLSTYLIGFLLGYAQSCAAGEPPFYRVVPSERLVYGKWRGDLFERQFDSDIPFDRFVKTLEDEMGEGVRRAELEHVQSLLASIECVDALR